MTGSSRTAKHLGVDGYERGSSMRKRELSLATDHIRVGQVYASNHNGDVEKGERQRRRVTAIDLDGPFVWLQTLDEMPSPSRWRPCPSRIRLRSRYARTIPGHRLVGDTADLRSPGVPDDVYVEGGKFYSAPGREWAVPDA